MQQKNKTAVPVDYDFNKAILLMPEKLIINNSERHSILINNGNNSYYYGRITNASNTLLKEMFVSKYPYYSKQINDKQWDKLTDGRCIQLKYDKNIKADAFVGLLGVNKDLLNGIDNVSDIIISAENSRIYIADMKNNLYYEFSNNTVSFSKLDSLITEVSGKTMPAGIFLNKLYPELYSSDFIIPAQTSMRTEELPAYTAENELNVDDKNDFVLEFFDPSSTLSTIKDSEGAVTYNDREGAMVKIDANGVLEYNRYNLSTEEAPKISLAEAMDISTEFINKHLGFPDDSYITGVQSYSQGARYYITFNYRCGGTPVMLDSQTESNAIEIELVGREVKRYKRQVIKAVEARPLDELRAPTTILDAVFHESAQSGETISKINNMKIVYLERNTQGTLSLIPAWVVDVVTGRQENDKNIEENRQYIINAETGLIIGK